MVDDIKLTSDLVRHEGLRLKPYKDTVGKLTIGIGRNLDDVGVTRGEAMILLAHDIERATDDARRIFPSFDKHNDVRQNVIVNMVFNLGMSRLLGFKKMIAAVKVYDYETASKEMLDSKWAKQVGKRATELSDMMRTGDYSVPGFPKE